MKHLAVALLVLFCVGASIAVATTPLSPTTEFELRVVRAERDNVALPLEGQARLSVSRVTDDPSDRFGVFSSVDAVDGGVTLVNLESAR